MTNNTPSASTSFSTANGEELARSQPTQDLACFQSNIVDIELNDPSLVEETDQESGDRFRIEVLERVVDEYPNRGLTLVVVPDHGEARGPRSHDLHQLDEPGVERSGTSFVRERAGERVELLQIPEPLGEQTAGAQQHTDTEQRHEREERHVRARERGRQGSDGERSTEHGQNLGLARRWRTGAVETARRQP